MKIGILIDQLVLGGVQKNAIQEVRQLRKLGHHATLLVLMRKGFQETFASQVQDIPVRFLSDRYPRLFRQSIKFPIFSFFSTLHVLSPFLAPSTIQRKDFDIIVSHGTTTCFTAHAISGKVGIPFIAVIHDPMEYILKKVYSGTPLKYIFFVISPLLFFLEKSFIRESKKTLVVSSVHQQFIYKHYGFTPDILTAGSYVPQKYPSTKRTFLLALSRWDKDKRPTFFLDLLKNLPSSVKLAIVGIWTSQTDEENFLAEVARRKMGSRVKVLGYVPESKLSTLASKALLWVHPNFEAFGVGGVEAASNGCPIIIPKGSGVTDFFEHGVHGFFPESEDVKSFLPYVRRLLTDETLRKRMAEAAYERAKTVFSWESHAQKLLEYIRTALNPPFFRIAVLETGHASESYLSGGDKLLEAMARYLPPKYKLYLIVPQIGLGHWKESGLSVDYDILPKTIFDNKSEPAPIFLAYCVRMWKIFQRLRQICFVDLLYSSTNVLPDILPAYLYKKMHPDMFWTARIHHLVLQPFARPGNFIVNLVSYYMQKLSLFCLKDTCDVVIALNSRLYTELLKQGFSRKNMRILGAGIEVEKIRSYPILPKTKQYEGVYLGRLHPTKGVFDLIPIWKNVLSSIPHARLAVIGGGSGEVKTTLEKACAKEGLSQHIDLLGFLPEKKLFSILKTAKVFLFTDHEAGWGLAIAEAMSCGLPVVGYNLPIFHDVYRQGFLTVPKTNTHAFAQKIIDLLQDEKKREMLSLKALRQAQKLSWTETTKTFLRYLKEIESKIRSSS